MEQEQVDNGIGSTSCVASIIEAYLIATSIHEQQKEVRRFTNSRKSINKNFSHERYIARKTESTISKLESAALVSKKRLKTLEKHIIEKVMNKVVKAIERKAIIDAPMMSEFPFGLKDSLALTQESEEIEEIKKRVDKVEVEKLGNSQDIHTIVERANGRLFALIQSDNKVAELNYNENVANMNKLLQEIQRASSKEYFDLIVDNVNHKLFRTDPDSLIGNPTEKSALVQQIVINYFREKFLNHLLDDQSNIYPEKDEHMDSLQTRDTVITKHEIRRMKHSKYKQTLIQMKKMNRESDEMLLRCDAILNSWPVRDIFRNLDYINHITKNHKEVLSVISDPWGDIKQSIREKAEHTETLPEIEIIGSPPPGNTLTNPSFSDSEYIIPPPEIRLYPENKNLSATLATSIAEYTKQLYFSDLTQRVEELEKRLQ